ncbi:glycosyltransferase family 4 protein [Akkermansiaceae bacterium]|nr:glycosyltransferase family 4 protein [Akkermansiaceae bacterium]
MKTNCSNSSSKKNLIVDASRLKSGGGILHLSKILELEKYSPFDKITVYAYKGSVFERYESNKVFVKTHPYINRNILFQIFWQRYLLKRQISYNDLLFTIDSTSVCRFSKNVVLNQDIIGFQVGSLRLFSFKNKIVSFIKYLVSKYSIKSSKATIFTTQFARQEVLKKTGAIKQSFVVPHGIDTEFIEKKTNYEIDNDSLKIIYVSPVLDYKNHQYLISALNKLTTTRQVRAYFVGGGDPRLIDNLKLYSVNDQGNQFHFTGPLKREDVYALTRSSDIAVFLSSVECFGITLLEYMRIGMPIVCSSESSLPETIGKAGLLVNPLDVKSIVNAIEILESNLVRRERFGRQAYKDSLNYSWDETVKKTFSILYQQAESRG